MARHDFKDWALPEADDKGVLDVSFVLAALLMDLRQQMREIGHLLMVQNELLQARAPAAETKKPWWRLWP